MKKVNLRDLYPDIYKNDYFVEVTEDVLETIRAAERAEAAYDRRMYRYKAYYSLNCDNGIENSVIGAYTIQALTTTLYAMNVKADQLPVYKAIVVVIIVTLQSDVFKKYIANLKAKRSVAAEGGQK